MIKKIWGIQVVKDLFWFGLDIFVVRLIWKSIEFFEVNSDVFFTTLSSAISCGYVKAIDFFEVLNIAPYLIIDRFTFVFYENNMTFEINPACAGTHHYFYFLGSMLFFPNLNLKIKLLTIAVGIVLLYLLRILVLTLQMYIFVKYYQNYEHIHFSSGYIFLTGIFIIWLIALKVRDYKR